MVKTAKIFLSGVLFLAVLQSAFADSGEMSLPRTVVAGSAFSVQTAGSGRGALYIVGPGQVLRRDVQFGEPLQIAAGVLDNAGHYLAVLVGGSSPETEELDVLPADHPAVLSFLARPSRLPINLHDGISGAVYVYDVYHNLITAPATVSFDLSGASGTAQSRTVQTRNGAAWTQMSSSSKEGIADFVATAGGISSKRIIQQVPGDPCSLHMTAQKAGNEIELATDPLRDCSGNPVPDGTIVTFTESYRGTQTTVDVPLKRGIAQAAVPAYPGATISVATGVVMGNEIRWGER